MKKTFVAALFSVCLTANADQPGRDKFGLGGMIGTMVSATGKYWISDKGAIDFGLGFYSPAAVGYADYLYRLRGLFGRGTRFGRETDAYVGGGGGIGFWSECGGQWGCKDDKRSTGMVFFARAMFGAEWSPRNVPIGVFAELGPAIEFVPVTGGFVDFGTGCRYYF